MMSRYALRCLLLLSLATPCAAQVGDEELRRCLSDFGGMEWRLPYRPAINVRACTSPAGSYDTSPSGQAGQRDLELIGEISLGPDSLMDSEQNRAAVQQAVYVHFDQLFAQHGFRRIEVKQGSMKRVGNSPDYLRRAPPAPEVGRARPRHANEYSYVTLARYAGQLAGHAVTLTYQPEMANIWRIRLEGLPTTPLLRSIVQ